MNVEYVRIDWPTPDEPRQARRCTTGACDYTPRVEGECWLCPRCLEKYRREHDALVAAAKAYLSTDLADDYWQDILESHGNCGCDWCARAARVLAARKALRAALALAKGDVS
jgi:hypothetical protein